MVPVPGSVETLTRKSMELSFESLNLSSVLHWPCL